MVIIRDERTSSDIPVHAVIVTAVVGLLAWLVLVALVVGLGALVTHLVVGHALGRGDLDVARWFADRRTDTWNTVSHIGSYLAETVTVLVVLGIALGVLATRRAWAQCALLVIAMAAEGGVYLVATYFVSRNRPAVPRLEHLIVTDSYPSGHTAAAMAMYGSLCIVVWSLTRSRAWRRLFLALAVVCPLAVGTSRSYRGMHNVSDVVCGLLIGAGCIVVGIVAVRAGRDAVRRDADRERAEAAADAPMIYLVKGVA
jgi:membrane-associated phospholipid phosphatase